MVYLYMVYLYKALVVEMIESNFEGDQCHIVRVTIPASVTPLAVAFV